jgi:glycosyltransferase involved in cell wall biosynthesis
MLTPYTNELFNELASEGMDLAVLACTEQEANRNWAKTFVPKYRYRVLSGWYMRLGSSRFAHINWGIVRALRQMKPDLLVISGFYPSMLIATIWAVLTRTPLSLTCDGWRHTMPMSVYHRIVRPWILRHCSVVMACGLKGRAFFIEEGVSPDNVFVVPLNPAWRQRLRTPPFEERMFHLLWCGHLTNDVKNADFFLRVCVELKKRIPNLRVRIIGGGPEESAVLGGLASAGIEFRHDRSVPWNQMDAVYVSAKLLLFPSRWEAWGLVCNEALQSGVPCLVSPFVGAAGDLIQDGKTGFVLPLESEIWSEKAHQILTNEDFWTAVSSNGLCRAQENSIEKSATIFRTAALSALRVAT